MASADAKLGEDEVRTLRRMHKGLTATVEAKMKLVVAGKLDPERAGLNLPQKQELALRLRAKRRYRALTDFFYFSKYVYGNADLAQMHRELCKFVTSKGKRKLILEPRSSLKSSVVTQSYTLWRLVRDPNLRVLIDSEEYSRAKDFVKAIKAVIEQNPNFRELFGALDRKKNKPTWTWTENSFTIATRTHFTKEANVMCMGVDSTRTGYHFDLVIMDDVVSDKNIQTDAQLRKIVDHYRLMLSILDPGKELIVIGTRWHFADLYGYLLAKDEERVKKDQPPQWKTLIRAAVNSDGTLLWPERLTRAFLAEMRVDQGPWIFACQYLNSPAGGKDSIFKKGWLRFFSAVPEVPLAISVVLDPALGKNKKSDFSAITVQARDPENNRYMLRVMRGRWNPTRTLQMFVMVRQWTIDTYGIVPRMGMDTQAFQWVLKHNLLELMRRGRVPTFKIHELTRTNEKTKHLSIEKLVPVFENGHIYLRGASAESCSPGAKYLIEEYLQFPVGKHDDILDTLAYHEELAKIPQVPYKDRKEDTVFQKVLKDAKRRGARRGKLLEVGSRITGGNRWQSGTSLDAALNRR